MDNFMITKTVRSSTDLKVLHEYYLKLALRSHLDISKSQSAKRMSEQKKQQDHKSI